MRILTWNVNHRTCEKEIPQELVNTISIFAPDILVLTEFVDSGRGAKGRDRFYHNLSTLGLKNHIISSPHLRTKNTYENQVLIVSKYSLELGEIIPVLPTKLNKEFNGIRTNFLHVRLPEKNLEVIGLRTILGESESIIAPLYWETLTNP